MHIHAHNYSDDTIITLQNILTVQISIKIILKKKKTEDARKYFEMALHLSNLRVKNDKGLNQIKRLTESILTKQNLFLRQL